MAMLCLKGVCCAEPVRAAAGGNAFETTVRQAVAQNAVVDLSDSARIKIAAPRCAYINIEGTDRMPQGKTESKSVWMNVYTDDGSHFRKRALISAQGNSSLMFPKMNFKATFCEDEWTGDATTRITIGEWVEQDGFQFKSYYIDYLRGVGVVGYQLYDQMAQTVGRPWTRAAEHIEKPKQQARCYPDGFPAIVYLNGDFYGIFAWQLKKHRDNMNQKKKAAGHIHLDGKISVETFWDAETVDWKQFEVRNPKRLYAMDGSNYDGDNPRELMDASSDFFTLTTDDSSIRADKERTAAVKRSVMALSRFNRRMQALVDSDASDQEVRSFFESCFDLPSLVDYACFHMLVNNYDGFAKNWQWFTYDGVKWFVAPYDLDCIMGNWFMGTFIIPADRTYLGGGTPWYVIPHGPFKWLARYYADTIRSRYVELRDAGVISVANIFHLLDRWYDAVSDFYDDEWRRWPDSMCISETIAADGWTQLDEGYNMPEYDDKTVYQPGDRCTLDGLAWEATKTVRGVKPYVQLGYNDSLERYKSWIETRIALLDKHYDYVGKDDTVAKIAVAEWAADSYDVYDMSGRKLTKAVPGLNILRYKDGRSRKVFMSR